MFVENENQVDEKHAPLHNIMSKIHNIINHSPSLVAFPVALHALPNTVVFSYLLRFFNLFGTGWSHGFPEP
jgi:hypothetical protein